MPRIVLLAAVAIVLYLLIRRAQSAPPHRRRSEYIKLGLGVALVLVVILALAGKMHWLGVAFTGLLVVLRQMGPLLIRMFPMLASKFGGGGPSPGQTSTVATDLLNMRLDHDSGELSGEVLEGRFKGWRLADMDRGQLRELLVYCRERDGDSEQLLSSYLQQRFPGADDWTEDHSGPTTRGSGMRREEALAVLGLDDEASDEDIVAAHRKLMQKLHPDRGGNDYLAAKINQAKDCLLG